jgi:hypothetical protein
VLVNERFDSYVSNPDVKKDLYWKLKLYRDLCPSHQDRFFCHGATKKTIDEWIKNGKKWKVNPNCPIGKNMLGCCSPLLCELAGLKKRIGNHLSHGYGINLMANATNVSLEESMNAVRHKSTTTHAGYQRPSAISEYNCLTAIHIQPTSTIELCEKYEIQEGSNVLHCESIDEISSHSLNVK